MRLKNNDLLVGEIKSLTKGVLTVKTSYSDKDFKIEFDEVVSMKTSQLAVFYLTNLLQITGLANPLSPGKVRITDREGRSYDMELRNIVQMHEIYEHFWKRFTGALDIGINLAKTNNNTQLTFAGFLKYTSDRWNSKFDYNFLYTDRDNSERIERNTMSLGIQRYFGQWYLTGVVSYLKSTELGLENRTTPVFGAGYILSLTNKLYWTAGAGLSYNIEEYFDSQLNKQSTELQLQTEFEMFNFEDIDFTTRLTGYPSLSEKGRFRMDYSFVFKYDLPLDFYIKAEFTLNYDNQPAVAGNSTDYLFSSGFGWELK